MLKQWIGEQEKTPVHTATMDGVFVDGDLRLVVLKTTECGVPANVKKVNFFTVRTAFEVPDFAVWDVFNRNPHGTHVFHVERGTGRYPQVLSVIP